MPEGTGTRAHTTSSSEIQRADRRTSGDWSTVHRPREPTHPTSEFGLRTYFCEMIREMHRCVVVVRCTVRLSDSRLYFRVYTFIVSGSGRLGIGLWHIPYVGAGGRGGRVGRRLGVYFSLIISHGITRYLRHTPTPPLSSNSGMGGASGSSTLNARARRNVGLVALRAARSIRAARSSGAIKSRAPPDQVVCTPLVARISWECSCTAPLSSSNTCRHPSMAKLTSSSALASGTFDSSCRWPTRSERGK